MTDATPVDAVAIIGASCRLPGVSTLEQFWSMIADGRVAIERFGADAARREGVPETVLAQPGFVGAGGRWTASINSTRPISAFRRRRRRR